MTEPIRINENLIKFKVWSFYGNPANNTPKLFDAFNKIKVAKELMQTTAGTRLVIKIKRIREALQKESEIIDKSRIAIFAEFAIKDDDGNPLMENNNFVIPEVGSPDFIDLNNAYLEFLNQDIDLPYEKIKSTDVVGFDSPQDLDVLDGIIEIVYEE